MNVLFKKSKFESNFVYRKSESIFKIEAKLSLTNFLVTIYNKSFKIAKSKKAFGINEDLLWLFNRVVTNY